MSERFIIHGGKALSGTLVVEGSKNAALGALATSLITDQPCHFFNVPEIEDVNNMLAILDSIGVSIERPEKNQVILHAKEVNPEKLDIKRMGQIRASIVIMGALVARTKKFSLVVPGGDKIGSRPLEPHFNAFRDMGHTISETAEAIDVSPSDNVTGEITLSEISVTTTINVLLSLARNPNTVTIHCAAQDHSVVEVELALKALGVNIEGIGTHTLKVTGADKPKELSYTIMPDPIEVGTFISLAAATRSTLTIENVSPNFLRQELLLFKKIGVKFSLKNLRKNDTGDYDIGTVIVEQHKGLKAVRHLHNMPSPGILPDLLPPIAVLLTQADGTSLIHDWMYEGRLRYIGELAKMGASANVLDPHRAIIIGPTKLFGKEITSFDIRAGATLLIAALIADGESILNDVYHIDRGYQNIEDRLTAIGADIKRVK